MKKEEKIWHDFYAAAIAFRDLKPWEWMYDGDVFGVEDPETGQINYCCIMGNAGEVFALGYYLGEPGLKSYLMLLNQPDELTTVDRMALGLSQLMLKVEFVNRDELDKPDQDQIKKLGLKFRGKKQWVQARDVQPGYMPLPISTEQAQILTVGLQQAVDVAARYRNNEEVLGKEDTGETLIRRKVNGQWTDQYDSPKAFNITPFPVVIPNPETLEKARRHPQETTAWLFIYEYLPMPVGDESGKRYYFPKINIWVNYADNLISSFQLIPPGEEEKTIEEEFFKQLESAGFRPKQIGVNSVMAFRAIREFCNALDIELMYIPDEPIFEEVMQSFRNFI